MIFSIKHHKFYNPPRPSSIVESSLQDFKLCYHIAESVNVGGNDRRLEVPQNPEGTVWKLFGQKICKRVTTSWWKVIQLNAPPNNAQPVPSFECRFVQPRTDTMNQLKNWNMLSAKCPTKSGGCICSCNSVTPATQLIQCFLVTVLLMTHAKQLELWWWWWWCCLGKGVIYWVEL